MYSLFIKIQWALTSKTKNFEYDPLHNVKIPHTLTNKTNLSRYLHKFSSSVQFKRMGSKPTSHPHSINKTTYLTDKYSASITCWIEVSPSIAASSNAISCACAWEKDGAGEPLLSESSDDRPSGVKVCETTLGFLATRLLPPRVDASRFAPAPISLRATGCGLEGRLMSGLSVGPDFPKAKNSPAGVAWAVKSQWSRLVLNSYR